MLKYFSMMQRILNSKAHNERQRERLGFAIDTVENHSAAVKNIEGHLKRFIVKRGNNCEYLVEAVGFSGSENAIVELARSHVTDVLSAERSIGIGLLEKARILAQGCLTGMESAKAAYASYLIAHDTVGYGAISVLMEDKGNIEEIEIGSPEGYLDVYTSEYGRCSTNIRFTGEGAYRRSINMLVYEAEKELGESTPIIDAQVENVRVHAQIRPYAISGAAASIRLGKGKEISLYSMLRRGSLRAHTAAYLWMAVESGLNVIISGSPASGKTTMLSALGPFMPWHAKLVTIEEDINELKFPAPMLSVVALYGSRYGQISTRAQVLNALRMRPERIIIGEVRGEEAHELFAGANLGVPFMTTMHSSEEGVSILKKLLVKPMEVDPRSLSMLDISIYMRQQGLSERCISGITEYRWLSRAETEEGVELENGDAVRLDAMPVGTLSGMQESKVVATYAARKGISARRAMAEITKRASYLEKAARTKEEADFFEHIQKYR